MTAHAHSPAAAEETLRVRALARAVDAAQDAIRSGRLGPRRGRAVVRRLRRLAESLFPESGPTFDLIYRPRLERALAERRPPH
jgi:hypothetical protein